MGLSYGDKRRQHYGEAFEGIQAIFTEAGRDFTAAVDYRGLKYLILGYGVTLQWEDLDCSWLLQVEEEEGKHRFPNFPKKPKNKRIPQNQMSPERLCLFVAKMLSDAKEYQEAVFKFKAEWAQNRELAEEELGENYGQILSSTNIIRETAGTYILNVKGLKMSRETLRTLLDNLAAEKNSEVEG